MALWLGLIVLASAALGFAFRRFGLARPSAREPIEAPP
jgi:hypothetical protein